ncbi:MAG: VOC family protein [Rhodospirillales bacterium]|nr:VOC family protein [Rhodospirillales bacterium]
MTLPAAILDHVAVNVGTAMDAAAETWTRLGFTLTPRGRHSLGSINHLAVFATDYLELIGVPDRHGARADLLDWPAGLNGLVFATDDADALHRRLGREGVPSLAPGGFSRPVDIDGQAHEARFRTLRLPPETTPAGRIYFCQHFTRHLVWRDAWRHHPNGTTGIAAVLIGADRPDRLGDLFARLFGHRAVHPIAQGMRLTAGLIQIDVVHPQALAARFGQAAPGGDDRHEYMAALVLRTASLAQTSARLAGLATHPDAARAVVPAGAACGVTLEFREA